MKKVYVVTSGEYSEYGIEAIFDDEDLAKKFMAMFEKKEYDNMKIEEHILNPFKREIAAGFKAYEVIMKKSGDVVDIKLVSDLSETYTPFLDFHYNLCCTCFAKDEQHAIKIANEKCGQLIAMNQWK